jgi:hypothetical protein
MQSPGTQCADVVDKGELVGIASGRSFTTHLKYPHCQRISVFGTPELRLSGKRAEYSLPTCEGGRPSWKGNSEKFFNKNG